MKSPFVLLVRSALAAAVLAAAPLAQAEAVLQDAALLKLALRSGPPCCVIDARPDRLRAQKPLAEALAWRDDLKVAPMATVVVVAESDAHALEVARALAGAHPDARVIAVAGGVAAWESVLASISDPPGGRAPAFVIPRNTCEQGTPLQQLRTAPK